MRLSIEDRRRIDYNIGKIGLLIAAAGLAMMGFGTYRGEAAAVLEKAINICLECIGIG